MPIIDFKATMCKHCYKCVRSCEVKAIMIRGGKANIMPNRCVLCGECLRICPQSAKVAISDLGRVREYIENGTPVVATLSSAFIGLMDFKSQGQVKGALMKLGFTDVRETAEGAALVTEEYIRMLKEGKMENIISSSCPSVNEMIEIHYPQLLPCLAPVATPATVHARLLKKEFGEEVKVAYIGPCIAKKREYKEEKSQEGLDAVLTYEDMNRWMEEKGIVLKDSPDVDFGGIDGGVNRLYAVTGGILSSIEATKEEPDQYRKFYVGGMKDCITACQSMMAGQVKNCFIEMSSCSGGCINGPAADSDASRFHAKVMMEENVVRKKADVDKVSPLLQQEFLYKEFHNKARKELIPSEEEIREILKKTGKLKPEHELNCGACGYPTCRDKAIAIFQKKAELDMCIPYMHERAESLANLVMETSPNMIMVLDENMRILECSEASVQYLGRTRSQLLRCQLDEFIPTDTFREVFRTHQSIHSKKVTYPEYELSTLQNIAYIEKSNLVIATFIDIAKEEEQARLDYNKKLETIELAQKVIHKQMMVAQEIAGLLGETTAETKTTLTKLCRSLLDEGSESEVQ